MAFAMRRDAQLTSEDVTPEAAANDDLADVAAAQHDLQAFAPLYLRYKPTVYHYCLRRLSNPEAAADATSLVFTRAVAALPRFRPDPRRAGSTFRSWLFTIAHNVIVDEHRRTRPTVSIDQQHDDNPTFQLTSNHLTPEAHVVHLDDTERVARWLDHLPERQRAIVELRLAGLSGEEIAGTMGMSLSAIKSAQFRAYATLRSIIPGDHR
jgi:RNA polymerase sigma-70 factor (ECF subfamily)